MSGALLLTAFLAILLAAAERRSRRRLLGLGSPPTSLRRLLPDLCALAALALLLWPWPSPPPAERSAAGGPVLALAVDVSASMTAADPAPSRLEQARNELRTLIAGLPEARFALLPFAGEAILQVPPTTDREALLFFVERLSPGIVDAPGSAPEEAILAARRSLRDEAGERAVLLFSDGERTVPWPAPEAAGDIPVFVVPLGTNVGAPVTDTGGNLRTDADGRTVMSRPDLAGLRRLAAGSQGEVLAGDSAAPAVAPLLARWGGSNTAPDGATTTASLALAILLLLARHLPGDVASRKPYGRLLLLGALLVFAACRTEQADSGSGLFREAERLSRNGQGEEAARHFGEAARQLEGEERAAALFNRGTLLLKSGNPHKALAPLEQALLLLPGDEAIRRNLALALRAIGGERTPGIGEGEQESAGGDRQDMSRQQALLLLESVRPAEDVPAASHARVRETPVTRDW